jgi:hypothetical protein
MVRSLTMSMSQKATRTLVIMHLVVVIYLYEWTWNRYSEVQGLMENKVLWSLTEYCAHE